MVRKKILLIIIGIILLFGGYFSWKVYQDSTRGIIPLESLQVKVIKTDKDYSISAKADLDNFEQISNYQAIQIGNDVYLYFMKTKAIFTKTTVDTDLSNILVGDTTQAINNIYVVSGDDIVVKFNDSRYNYIDVLKYTDKKLLLRLN
ncbi:hypothetical protein OK495_06060 [Streptococcus pneumoniae]|nr:hypothetical protein [Streptococcus pneumoniae]VJL55638.1 Uncharacterised protein [Streptococcus pneumoniae]VLF50693.1 Uncharacterised protein [Streptococcus pneumoniae]VLR60517.1 Uncharacterised protein [Streptococcus pneumoniae]VMT08941.1 Uncharacterised protein [Streptococcus pneumoniae]